MNNAIPINQHKMRCIWGADPTRKNYGRPVRKASRRGKPKTFNKTGHRGNPHKK